MLVPSLHWVKSVIGVNNKFFLKTKSIINALITIYIVSLMYCFWISRYFFSLYQGLIYVQWNSPFLVTSLSFDRCIQWYKHGYSTGARQPWRPQIPPRPFVLSPSILLISLFAPGKLCVWFFFFFFSPLKFCLCSNIINVSIRNVLIFGTVHLRFIHYYMFCYFVPFFYYWSSVLLNGFTSLFTLFLNPNWGTFGLFTVLGDYE